jgi:hypothetical protein
MDSCKSKEKEKISDHTTGVTSGEQEQIALPEHLLLVEFVFLDLKFSA